MAKSEPAVRVIEETPVYWRAVFDNPPFNMMDDTIFDGLQSLLARMDASPNLRVVVFESENPEFYLAHFDLTGKLERLPHLVGRGRALEIVLGAEDFDGDTAERYGYVNRALPDAELDRFVDALARRISSFDRAAIATAKRLINDVSLPSSDSLLEGLTSFLPALTRPETLKRVQALFKRGLQENADFEKRWPEILGTLLDAGNGKE